MKTDNELIAEFMGSPVNYEYDRPYPSKKRVKVILKYDTSWDWLMPVVEKISELPNVYSVEIHIDATVRISSDSLFENLGGDIESCYKTVVEFIKWYNSQPKH
jgi:hypothetical protein